MRDVLKPHCYKCAKKPIVSEGFCMDCWTPTIAEEWRDYQRVLDNTPNLPSAGFLMPEKEENR